MNKQILIADKRKELSTKYKKIIESLGANVVVSNKLDEIFKLIQDIEPDLIIISDSIVEDVSDLCKKLRVLTFNTRPVIVALSKSAELNDKLKVLDSGADDFLSEPIQAQEFKMRIHAHLRREQESYINDKTGLPNKSYTLKGIKRAIQKKEKKAFILLGVENLDEYRQLYSDLASDKLIQTICAIVQSCIGENDFFGQISDNEFIIIMNSMYIEKIASFITFAVDTVVKKFYSQSDIQRGYIILQGDEKEGRRCEFVKSVISVVTNEFTDYANPQEIINKLNNLYKLAIIPEGSSYLIDRPQIEASDSINCPEYNNMILIMENDDALSFLLKTSIELQGYKVQSASNSEQEPVIIILDAGDLDNLSGLEKCKVIKEKYPKTKIIMTSILHDKEKILNSGADLYIPKPYNVITLLKWINVFVQEYNR